MGLRRCVRSAASTACYAADYGLKAADRAVFGDKLVTDERSLLIQSVRGGARVAAECYGAAGLMLETEEGCPVVDKAAAAVKEGVEAVLYIPQFAKSIANFGGSLIAPNVILYRGQPISKEA